MQSFLHGLILAFGLIMPLGVQNLFVFNQGAAQPNFWRALPVVAAASVCDTILILLAVQGVSLLLLKFALFKNVLIGAGALFLLYMGWLTWQGSGAARQTQTEQGLSGKQQILFAVSVSLLNPHAVLDTIGVIGTSSLSYEGQEKMLFTMACILVSWLWFFCLALLGRVAGSKAWFSSGGLLGKTSALFIWGSAVYMVAAIP
ncbi:MAG: LysE family transporter [Pelosinus sp.]|nr:LysE family transporter [Pelosinus sp.]